LSTVAAILSVALLQTHNLGALFNFIDNLNAAQITEPTQTKQRG